MVAACAGRCSRCGGSASVAGGNRETPPRISSEGALLALRWTTWGLVLWPESVTPPLLLTMIQDPLRFSRWIDPVREILMLDADMFGGQMKKSRISNVQIQGMALFCAVQSQRKVDSWNAGRGEL